MELYKKYIKEREGMELYYEEDGFISYVVYDDLKSLYLAEIFVAAERRGSRLAYNLYKKAIEIAMASGASFILGSVDISTNGWQKSEDFMIRLGFEKLTQDGNLIYYKVKL